MFFLVSKLFTRILRKAHLHVVSPAEVSQCVDPKQETLPKFHSTVWTKNTPKLEDEQFMQLSNLHL